MVTQFIQEFEACGGGFVPEIIGKRFAGKEDGTWRRVDALEDVTKYLKNRNVRWTNESGRSGECWWLSFESWCKKPAFVIDD